MCAGLIGYRTLRMAGDARADRDLRFRRRSAYRGASGAPSGPRIFAFTRPGDFAGAGFCAVARRRVGRRFRRAAARAARRGADLRPGRRAGSCRARRDGRRAAPSSAAASI